MMCLFKPNTYDPKDWQCPKPSCRTVNFKKRTTCISCGARKPEGSHRPLDDWRDGEKFAQGPWDCESCHAHNEPGTFYCMACKRPSTEMAAAMEEEKKQRAQEEGRGGGLFDRQDPNDKKQWDSDGEEFDEFGRRKKRRGAARATPGATAAAADAGPAGDGGFPSAASRDDGAGSGAAKKPVATDKYKAALERLRNKHAGGGGGGGREAAAGGGGGRDRDRRRSRSRSRRHR